MAKSRSAAQENSGEERTSLRDKLIGLGEHSQAKSYYPELKKRLEELERFRRLMDAAGDALFVVDPATALITDVAGSAERVLGRSREYLVGRRFGEFFSEAAELWLGELSQPEASRPTFEVHVRGLRGAVRLELNVQTAVVSGRIEAVVGARDVTERTRAHEELAELNRTLELRVAERTAALQAKNRELGELNQHLQAIGDLKSDFLSIASHEIRTPLTSLLGFAKLVARDFSRWFAPKASGKAADKGERIAKNLEVMIHEGRRLTQLVNDVLDLSKIESGRLEWREQLAPPSRLVSEAAAAAAGLFGEKPGVRFFSETAPGTPDLLVDPDRIKQVLINLLSNAVKFTNQGEIRLWAGRVGAGAVRFLVSDTGPGIPEERRALIFERFYQGPSERGKPKGTGLGLAISKEIVERCGGRIEVESGPSGGSVFSVTLPVPQSTSSTD